MSHVHLYVTMFVLTLTWPSYTSKQAIHLNKILSRSTVKVRLQTTCGVSGNSDTELNGNNNAILQGVCVCVGGGGVSFIIPRFVKMSYNLYMVYKGLFVYRRQIFTVCNIIICQQTMRGGGGGETSKYLKSIP